MSILCCCRSPKATCQQADPVTIVLPTEPPPVKLRGSPYSRNNIEGTPVQPDLTASAPSRLDSPTRQAIIDPAVLSIEDSDDEDSIFRSFRNSSISTLEVIKTKFIRRRSPASDAKARSQPAVVGNSDEEVARRAELKRIMHKRIQEELRGEHEKGRASGSDVEQHNHENGSPREVIQGGPRDTIEFSVDEMNEIKANGLKCTSPEFIPLALPVDENQMIALRRRSGTPESTRHSGDTTRTRYQIIVMERGSPSQIPSSPELAPTRLPSLHDSCSTHSWHLSFSAEQITSILGVHEGSTHRSAESDEVEENVDGISKNNNTSNNDGGDAGAPEKSTIISDDVTGQSPSYSVYRQSQESNKRAVDIATEQHTNPEVENEPSSNTTPHKDSPLDLWLRSQEFQAGFGFPSQKNKNTGLAEIPESYSREMIAIANQDKTDPAATLRESEVYYDAAIKNSLPDTSSQLRDSQPNFEKKSCELLESDDHNVSNTQGHHILMPDRAPVAPQESSSHYTSSRHTAVPSSNQPSRKSSRLSLKELLGGTKGTGWVPTSNMNRRRTETEKSGVSSYKTAPTGLPVPHIVPTIHSAQGPGIEADSLVISDTGSFKQRENELRSVEQRFGPTYRRQNRTLPTSSRFREEFDEPQATQEVKPSLFSKLRLPPMGRERRARESLGKGKSEGEIIKDSLLRKPHELVNRTLVTTRKSPEGCDGDGNPRLQSTLKTKANSHHSPQRETLSSHLHPYLRNNEKETDASSCSEKKRVSHVRENSTAEKTEENEISRPHSLKQGIRSSLQPPVEIHHDRTPASDISSRILHTWSRQLSTPSLQFQTIPKADTERRRPRRLVTPPKSWAKWPSHTRVERSGPAGLGDRVILRDFAVQDKSNADSLVATTEGTKPQSKLSLMSASRTFSSSLGRAMKQSLTKIIPTKEGSPSMKESREKHNGSLEYPELELLPMQGGYKDLRALEDQIDTMKHGTTKPEGILRDASIESINPPLSVRLAHDVHNLRCENDDINNSEVTGGITTSSQHNNHPETPSIIVATASDKLESPPSSVSYDDCVPKHMLDDNDSIKSYKTVLVKRSKSQRVGQRSAPGVTSNRHKYMTWHGRSMRQPVLLQSTLDFGAELDNMLMSARTKAIQSRNAEDTQKQTMIAV